MKKIFLLMTALLTFMACNLSCKALKEVYTNQAGVTMTLEQYNKLVEMFGVAVAETMNEEEIRDARVDDYTLLGETTKYIKTIYKYDIFGNISDEEEIIISEEDFLNSNDDISTFADCNAGVGNCWETDSKKIEIKIFGSSYGIKTVATNTWKTMPKIRSTEIMAMRYSNFTPVAGTQEGKLIYRIPSSSAYFESNYKDGNIDFQTFKSGFGATMSLPEDKTVYYLVAQLTVEGPRNGTVEFYASYQHARKNVSPLIARQYSISPNGLGGVIKIPSNVDSTSWDGMQGVHISL